MSALRHVFEGQILIKYANKSNKLNKLYKSEVVAALHNKLGTDRADDLSRELKL
jgi:hypothetical protein